MYAEGMPVRIRADIAELPPYRQGRLAGPDAFKLSSNENPFSPLPSVVEAIHNALDFNRYPDASALSLREALAERYKVSKDAVHVAAGSVSIIAQFMLATASAGDEVMFPWRSFEGYPILARVAGANTIRIALTPDHRHDLQAMASAVTERTRLIIICSPNNPTGTTVSKTEFEAFHAQVPRDTLILLDEAYAEFVTDPDALNGMEYVNAAQYANVVVLRTFSKAYGLAGLRVGYAIGHPRVLDAARATGIPLSVTGIAQAAALASLDAETELRARIDTLNNRRDSMVTALRNMGWGVPSAQGNFLWLPSGIATTQVTTGLQNAGLIVRPYDNDGVRITVGEAESVDVLIRTVKYIGE